MRTADSLPTDSKEAASKASDVACSYCNVPGRADFLRRSERTNCTFRGQRFFGRYGTNRRGSGRCGR